MAHSVPLFMVLGNHDGEKGTSGTGADDIGPWSYEQRTSRFPQPVTGAGPLGDGTFYTGFTAMKDGVGSNYYAFEWGDALFIVLDPYWSTTDRIRGGGGGGGKGGAGGGERGGGGGQGGQGGQRPNDEPLKPTDSSWTSTLGRTQYDWLTKTLEGTKAKYRFVFIHHLVGGMGGAESRGGVESSPHFEWGGKNADGSPGFAQHRAGWALPIHDLLVKHRVSAVFHGHDHLYVSSQRDGVVYQCVPQPGNPRGNTRTATQYGYVSGTLHGSPGHVRVRVEADKATVEFVRTALAGAAEGNGRGNQDRRGPGGAGGEANDAIVHSYTIAPVAPATMPKPESRP
ncbi:MAG: metallophosphoesterase [Planctomycetes bacterium]|nr:metallophosphoesterase [Planctomycetota bacterium]